MKKSTRQILKHWVKRPAINSYWFIYGRTIRNPQLPVKFDSVLFVCKGNICRSPYAEYASPKILKGTPFQHLKVHSAGLRVPVDLQSPPDAVAAAKRLGVDMHSHISRPLTPELVDNYNIILAMETWHVQSMKKKYRKDSNKFFLLPLYDPSKYGNAESFLNYNIEDPYGKPEERFKESFRRIERCFSSFLKQASSALK